MRCGTYVNQLVEQSIELRFVEKSPDDMWTVDLLFRRVKGRMQGQMISPIEIDSDDPKPSYPGLFDAKIRQLVLRAGNKVRLQVAANGWVQGVKGYEEIYADSDIGEQLAKDGDLLTNESFRDDAQIFFAHLPDKLVSEGDHWKSSYPMSVFLKQIDLKPRYELEEIEQERATFTFLGIFDAEGVEGAEASREIDPKASATEAAALLVGQSKITSASLQGQAIVSRPDGLLMRGTVERIIGAEVPNPFGGKAIPSVVIQRTEVRRLADKLDTTEK